MSGPEWLINLAPKLAVHLRDFRGVVITRATPQPDGLDWGQKWVIETISKSDPNSPVWLNIVPSQGVYNPHSFELLAKQMHAVLKPTTCRTWTIMGDRVEFSNTLGRMSNALSADDSARSAKVSQLAAQYQAGNYQPNATGAAHGMISEAMVG